MLRKVWPILRGGPGVEANAARKVQTSLKQATDRVVVCVCTKNRRAMFLQCFNSLLNQRIPQGSLNLSLVVVDNFSDAGERETVALHQDGEVPVLYVHEPRAGIPAARNAALEAAKSISPDWIAFIDDDEVAPPRLDRAAACRSRALRRRRRVRLGRASRDGGRS